MKPGNTNKKILKDRKLPTSEHIAKYQNFDKLQANYSSAQKLLLKKAILWGSAITGIVGVTAAGIIYLNSTNSDQKKINAISEEPKKKEICVQPPIPGKEVPYAIYRVSSKNGGVIKYPSGSSITIPANAFHKVDGKVVSDSIDIKYREFHTPLDIFLSGIPMEYDSAGIKRNLESAGMIEIKASDNGQDLALNEETSIDIKMATSSLDPKFNLYELDTTNINWIYKGKDKVEEPLQNKTISPKKNPVQTTQVANSSVRPIIADPKKFNFKIKSDKNEFPELAAYDNVCFEVCDNNFNAKYYSVKWKSITLHNSDVIGIYTAKLHKADTTISVNVRPVFSKENFEEAMKKFEAQHLQANRISDVKEIEEKKALKKVNEELATYNPKNIIVAANGMVGIMVGIRGFQVRTLGYHNIDFPMPPVVSYAYKIMANSAKKNGTNIAKTYSDIYLVQKGKNTVFRFLRGEPVRCNPEKENLMWTITNNNQIAFFRIQDFSKLENGGENNIDPVIAPDQDKAFMEIRKFSL